MVNFNSKYWTDYKNACNAYLKEFCEKHNFDYDEAKDSWVSNFAGTVVMCGDYFIPMENIIIDIELGVPEDEFIKWYDYSLEMISKNLHYINYESWLLGFPTEMI